MFKFYREKNVGETILTEKHLSKLMDGLKMYLTEQSLNIVENTVKQLKEQLDFDATAINQLQFAVYLFQVSIPAVFLYKKLLFSY